MSIIGREYFKKGVSQAAEKPSKMRLQSIFGFDSKEGHFIEMVEAKARVEEWSGSEEPKRSVA